MILLIFYYFVKYSNFEIKREKCLPIRLEMVSDCPKTEILTRKYKIKPFFEFLV